MKLFPTGLVLMHLVSPHLVKMIGESPLPTITDCAYVNAYLATCWWTRDGNSSTEYKLGYLTASDPTHKKREKYCQETRQSVEGDVTTESCGVEGSMFQRFTFWVGSVQDCNVTDKSCVTSRRGDDVIFTCTKENVKLTIAPEFLSIDPEARRVSWKPPDLTNSMLDFTLKLGKRKALYKVELKEEGQREWQECYRGYDTGTFLPTLLPGTSYKVRVFASLDRPPSGINPASGSPHPGVPAVKEQWSHPSNVLVFMVPMSDEDKSDGTEVEDKYAVKGAANSTTTSGYVTKSRDAFQQHLVLTSLVTSFAVILILCMVGYYVPRQKWCCKVVETKTVKPQANVGFGKNIGYEPQQDESVTEFNAPDTEQILSRSLSTSSLQDSQTQTRQSSLDLQVGNEEAIEPIRAFAPTSEVYSPRRRPDISQEEGSASCNLTEEFARTLERVQEQLASPDGGLVSSLSVRDDLRHVANTTTDLTPPNDVVTVSDTVSLEESRLLLHQSLQESNELNYLITSERDGETMVPRSLDDYSSVEYVTNIAGKNSTFTDDLSCVTDMTSLTADGRETQNHGLNFLAKQVTSSDNISDYVIQASMLGDDFSRNMKLFVAMATKDATCRRSDDVGDKTTEFLSASGAKTEPLYLGEREKLSTEKSGSSSSEEEKSHPYVTSYDTSNSNDVTEDSQESTNRNGSLSKRSVDSGYISGSPACGTPLLPKREALLYRNTSVRSNLTCGLENGDSDSDSGYLAYVPT